MRFRVKIYKYPSLGRQPISAYEPKITERQPSMENQSGTVVRGYELRNLLGEGGFGAVYRAYQPAVKREVALKVILPEFANHPDFIRSFESEAQIIARLEHLHIVPLYDFWRDPDGAFLVMRLLKGGSLRGLIEQGPLSLDKAARMLNQVAAALHTAHRNDIIHRDIKPDNVLIDEEHNAFLTDFGIALDLEQQDEDDFDDSLTGSPHYISPEQAQQEPVSPRSDIYSLGIVLFEMLTGEAPFAGNTTMMELILKQINEPLPPVHTLNPDVPDEIDLIIQRATDKNPNARYASVLEFAAAFQQAIPGMATPSNSISTEIDVAEIQDDEELVELVVPSSDNPYKGLRPFEEADADDFYGRDALIARLKERVIETNFMAVIGPSGSGKSSAVKAGLIPALRRGEIDGSDRWFYAEMVPGVSPFQELASALLSIASSRHPQLEQELRTTDNGLLEAVGRVLPDDKSQLMLTIDQFEEVFTQVDDENERANFLSSLLVATTAPDSRLRIIVTMRADFYDRPLMYPGFGELIRRYSEVVLPLSAEEMQAAIIEPAKRIGMEIEQALTAAIIAEIETQPGALPLLQYALTEVFERREGNRLTYKAYQDSGGVLGALARRAEEIFIQLPELKQETARQMFLRLVTLGEGSEDTRRRILQGELLSVGDDAQATQEVLDVYSRYRLLTFDNDPVTRDPTVEVAHEALIREWQRLREWLNESRDDVRTQQRLASAARVWHSENRDTSFLASGMRLEQFEQLLDSGNISLAEEEIAYTKASIAERDRQAAEEVERAARERQLEKRARQRLQAGLGIFVLAFVVAAGLAFFAVQQSNAATRAEETAVANEQVAAEQRDLAEAAATEVQTSLLAEQTAQAVAVENQLAAQRESSRILSLLALQQLNEDTVAGLNIALRAFPDLERIEELYVPEAELALSSAMRNSVERAYTRPLDESDIFDVAFGETSAAYISNTALATSNYELDNVTLLLAELGGGAGDLGVAWSSGSQWLSYSENLLYVWENNQQVTSLETEASITCAAWRPDTAQIAVCQGNGAVVWNPVENARITLPPLADTVSFLNVAWLADNETLVIYDTQHIMLWNAASETTVARLQSPEVEDAELTHGHANGVTGVMPLVDGSFVTFGREGTLFIWNTSGELLHDLSITEEAPSDVTLVSRSPNGDILIIVAENGQSIIWSLEGDTPLEVQRIPTEGNRPLNIAWRDNNILAMSYLNGVITVWDIRNERSELLTELYGVVNANSPRIRGMYWDDDRHLVSASETGGVHRWEVFNENGVPNGDGIIWQSTPFERGLLEEVRWLDNETILAKSDDGYPRRYNFITGQEEVFDDAEHTRWRVAWGEDGQRFVWYDDRGGRLELWDFDAREMLFGIDDVVNNVFWLEVGIFYTDGNGSVKWLDFEGNLLAEFVGSESAINDIRYSAVNNRLAIAEARFVDNNPINIYRLPATSTLPLTAPLEPDVSLNTEGRPPVRLTWYDDGIRMASIGFNGDVQLWDTTTGNRLSIGFTGLGDFPGREAVDFSPSLDFVSAAIDDEILVFNFDGEIIFRQTEGNAVLGTDWITHDSRERLLAWGNTTTGGFVTILDMNFTDNQFVEVWRTEDVNQVRSATANPDGTALVIGGRDRSAIVFQLWPSLTHLLDDARTIYKTRDLTADQRSRFNIRD